MGTALCDTGSIHISTNSLMPHTVRPNVSSMMTSWKRPGCSMAVRYCASDMMSTRRERISRVSGSTVTSVVDHRRRDAGGHVEVGGGGAEAAAAAVAAAAAAAWAVAAVAAARAAAPATTAGMGPILGKTSREGIPPSPTLASAVATAGGTVAASAAKSAAAAAATAAVATEWADASAAAAAAIASVEAGH